MFKKLSLLLVVTLIVSVVSFVPQTVSLALGENLLANYDPSFEKAPFTGTMQNDTDKVSGSYCMEFGANSFAARFVYDVPLKPSTQYAISFYFKTLTSEYNKIEYGLLAKAEGVVLNSV